MQAAVPNWLREEIIKNKSVLPSAVSTQPTGISLALIGSEDGDKSIRRADPGDSKSMDSTRSIEDEEDDEVISFAFGGLLNVYILMLFLRFLSPSLLLFSQLTMFSSADEYFTGIKTVFSALHLC